MSTSWSVRTWIVQSLLPAANYKIGTYTTDKIKVILSCTLFVVHPDTQCLKEVTFHVTSHEGSVVLSCATTLELSLIQPHNNLDFIPSSTSLISSNADHPRKNKSQKSMLVSKPNQNVCSSKEQSHIVLPQMNLKLISVLYMNIKKKQASRSVQPMKYLCMKTRTVNLLCVMTRTVRIPNVCICSQ